MCVCVCVCVCVCLNELISSHWFVEHLKQNYIQNSEKLFRMPVDEKDGFKKMATRSRGY